MRHAIDVFAILVALAAIALAGQLVSGCGAATITDTAVVAACDVAAERAMPDPGKVACVEEVCDEILARLEAEQ